MTNILDLKNIEANYGPISAVKGISMTIGKGNITTVLGANGAGKTTVLRVISGIVEPSKGSIEYEGNSIEGIDPHRLVHMGISQVPEGREIFTELTVLENLRMGARASKEKESFKTRMEEISTYFPVLMKRPKQLGGTLSGGEQQMLAIARSLMSNPKLLLLDEPSLGLSPILVKTIFKIIGRVNGEEGTTILLVEQNARMALSLAQYGYILEVGRIVLEDSSEELIQNEDVREFYLGQKERSVRGSKRWKRKKKWR